MRRSRRWSDAWLGARAGEDRGTASLEFITLGVLLLVPLVYLVLALAAVQAAAFAAEGSARHAARVAVLARDESAARTAADRAVRLAFADFGLAGAAAKVQVACDPADRCAEPGTRIEVRVAAAVPLPFVPDLFGARFGTVHVDGVATQTVSKYASGVR